MYELNSSKIHQHSLQILQAVSEPQQVPGAGGQQGGARQAALHLQGPGLDRVLRLRRRHQGQGPELHAPGPEQAQPQTRDEQQQPEALQGPQRDVYVTRVTDSCDAFGRMLYIFFGE